MDAVPPRRPPYHVSEETFGWPLDRCARGLVWMLSLGLIHGETHFTGSAKGRAWVAHNDDATARIAFATGKGDGHIELSVHDSAWVKIEVFVAGLCVFRAWCDEPWEEKEFWPDGSDGVTPPDGDAPGRISKRGSWLKIKCAYFPGVPDDGSGYWSLALPE
jgi:hypothetical protein